MATDLSPVKTTPNTKYDAFVASQLGKAKSRIRLLDLTAALLGFVSLSLVYVVGVVLCDGKLELSAHTRQLALYAFLAGSAFYLFFTVIRPLGLRVNPYYAARQVELLLPGAKNSIVNWVDLHQEPLPLAIRGALGQRAAKDLSHVDLDRAISGRRTGWMGGIAGLCVAAFIVSFFLLGPAPFFSLLKRAFNPFGQTGVSTRTQLAILKPEGGNTTVTVGRGVSFIVDVSGKVPDPKAADAVKLLYRYEENDPWLERLLLPELGREWTTTLSGEEVKNGFWYKITGGDAATQEYRISVRAAPAIMDFLAIYHYRPYVARADEVHRERDLKAIRGTEVQLRVRTNRTLREGRLDFEGKDGTKQLRGEPAAEDPRVLSVRFVLDEDGHYRLHFTSTESDAYSDPVSYLVKAILDKPPVVELTKPGQDIRLPADGLLHLEGKASDDIGVKSLTLRMQVVGGSMLQGQPYRSDDKLRLADGGYSRELEYKDFVDLVQVKSEDGRPFLLRAGMELEYWLEASDACDYPRPNISESKHYRVRITEPEKNEKKARQDKKRAERNQKQHEGKQDQKLKQEDKERQQERKNQEAQNKEEMDKSKDADKGAASENSQRKEDSDPHKNAEGQENKGQASGPSNGQSDKNNDLSRQDQDTEKAIKDALEKKEQQQNENRQGEAKPDPSNQGEGKGAQQNKSDGAKQGENQAGEKSQGEGKSEGRQGAKETGEGKDKGPPQPGADASQGDGKGDNQPSPMQRGDKSESKDGNPTNQPGIGEQGEGKGKPDQPPSQSEGKSGGNPQESKGAGQGKPKPMGQGQDSSPVGEGKPMDPKGQNIQRERAAEAKDNPGTGTKSEVKGPGDNKDDGKAEVKQSGAAPRSDQSVQGESKPSPRKTDKQGLTRGEPKPDAGAQSRKASPKDVADLLKDLTSDDAQRRQEAQRKLEQIKKQAHDPLARQKAEDALDQVGQPDDRSEAKPPQKKGMGQPGEPRNEGKDGKGTGLNDAGTSKPSSDNKKQSNGDPKNADKSSGEGSKGQEDPSSPNGTAKEARNVEAGNTAGGGGNQRRTGNTTAGPRDSNPMPDKPSKPRDHRATMMQLEDFFKKVDKNVLKDAGISEETWKKYIESKRKQVSPPETVRPEIPAAPQQGTKLPSIGGQQIKPAPSDQPNDVHGPDHGQPPPGYRDPFREFTRQMSKTGSERNH